MTIKMLQLEQILEAKLIDTVFNQNQKQFKPCMHHICDGSGS